jgi:gamma-butyrobetaine dioxygenase
MKAFLRLSKAPPHIPRPYSNSRLFSKIPQKKIQFGSPLSDPIDDDFRSKKAEETDKLTADVTSAPVYNPVRFTENSYHRVSTVEIEGVTLSKLLLRDACTCSKCVDPSSTQKNFQTTQIPKNIDVGPIARSLNGNIEVTWENDIPGIGSDHVSTYSRQLFQVEAYQNHVTDPQSIVLQSEVSWDAKRMREKLQCVRFEDYMSTDQMLSKVLFHLNTYGLIILKEVPSWLKDKAVELIAERIGSIRDTFYGRTWDVRSVPDAKNVAYTSRYLGLHMDLLYMANPPGYQFLHCMENSAEGGASIFSDASWAASQLSGISQSLLKGLHISYQYKNAGEHYFNTHPVLETQGSFHHINYSPPFQAPFSQPPEKVNESWYEKLDAFREFAAAVEDPANVLEYRLKEGECVIFNNRRVLHGRKAFDALGGKRHYKGAYIDTDVVSSRYRVLKTKRHSFPAEAEFVFPREIK